ncbi:NAD(P)-dependent alcohol dehydrogenase [Aspergillus candidus]|uniref:NAD(P)-binding protein n=1 Tax=Aspergillus candidus TaxID=41067 RepID=A0A2I2FCK4_ASPCN|nr:NAD(P)-binding protein [Aspergillus candidus]PLB38369.1 NAD(P)-binding protein [Aspergillus candidus]
MSIPTTAIVARTPGPNGPNWALEQVETVSSCGADEVLVEMVATGVCHTDMVLSSVPDGMMGVHYPKVVGHEGAGYIRAINPSTKSVSIGDPVLLSFKSCSSCTQCRRRHPAHCDHFNLLNLTGKERSFLSQTTAAGRNEKESIWGSFFGQSSYAKLSIVHESCLVNVKDVLGGPGDLATFAPMGCSFQTGVGAVRNVAAAGEDDVVLVMGLGGVGMASVMAAKLNNCQTIIALDQQERRLQLARSFGATHTINTASSPAGGEFDFAQAVKAICPDGPSVVIDTTGVPKLIEAGLATACARGKLVLIGATPLGYTLDLMGMEYIASGKSVIGCVEGDSVPKEAIIEMIKWFYEGRFPIDKLNTYIPIKEYQKALAGLASGEIIKAVLLWDKESPADFSLTVSPETKHIKHARGLPTSRI